MATTIRLKRVGAKKEASFRIVVMDSREGTAGKSIERLGTYNPRTSPSLIKINAARTIHWLHEGAVPSDSVRSAWGVKRVHILFRIDLERAHKCVRVPLRVVQRSLFR